MTTSPRASEPSKYTPGPQYYSDRSLPDPLPEDPMAVLRGWMDEVASRGLTKNPNAMTLATVGADGRPTARVLLCKELDAARGTVVFFTNRDSQKGRAVHAHPYVACVFHWDMLNLQARIEGPVTHVSDEESDEYWRSRFVLSRLGAWASEQSRPIGSREAMLEKVRRVAERFGVAADGSEEAELPRPPNWGGYRVWAERLELWVGQPGRIHDRGRWTRALTPSADGFRAGAWASERLQP